MLHAARQPVVGLTKHHRWSAPKPRLREPEVDSAMSVEVAYPGGIRGRLRWDMNAAGREMVWTVVGTAVQLYDRAFAVPQMDNRIVVTRDGSTEKQTLWRPDVVHLPARRPGGHAADRRRVPDRCRQLGCQAELIDEVYRRAGLSLVARISPAHPAHLRDGREPVRACCTA